MRSRSRFLHSTVLNLYCLIHTKVLSFYIQKIKTSVCNGQQTLHEFKAWFVLYNQLSHGLLKQPTMTFLFLLWLHPCTLSYFMWMWRTWKLSVQTHLNVAGWNELTLKPGFHEIIPDRKPVNMIFQSCWIWTFLSDQTN